MVIVSQSISRIVVFTNIFITYSVLCWWMGPIAQWLYGLTIKWHSCLCVDSIKKKQQ